MMEGIRRELDGGTVDDVDEGELDLANPTPALPFVVAVLLLPFKPLEVL